MKIYGLDFTSAPTRKKPLTLATCWLEGGVLHVQALDLLPTFADYEAFLATAGAWVAGLDFAFGQPLKLIENLELPRDWCGYVGQIADMGKREWVRQIDAYAAKRPLGDKLHLRETDRLAGAQSPMRMYYIPVGRMFYEGATRLLATPLNVMPNRPTEDARTVLEVYPALVARRWVGRGSGYKTDNPAQQTLTAEQTRTAILQGLGRNCVDVYGFEVILPPIIAEACILDASGDKLDAVLAAVQAAWGYTQRHVNYGIPPDVNRLEGWIIDPLFLESSIR